MKENLLFLTFCFAVFLSLSLKGSADAQPKPKPQTAVFAGGCFWCMEPPFEKMEGVLSVVSGYTGGHGSNPTYEDYSRKGHVEAILVSFNPQKVTYQELLDVFWKNIDPTDPGGQFVDRGPSYRSAIFYLSDEQKAAAEASKAKLEQSGVFKKPIVTEILKAGRFAVAEEYHQDYYKNHPFQYKFYRYNSGRDRFLEKVWKKE